LSKKAFKFLTTKCFVQRASYKDHRQIEESEFRRPRLSASTTAQTFKENNYLSFLNC